MHLRNGGRCVGIGGIKMQIVVAIIGSGALSAIISGIFALVQTRLKRKDGVSKGVQTLLYDRIKFLGKHYIAYGQVSTEELEDLIAMHRIYHDDLGGNGYLDELMRAVKALPIKVG